MFYAVHCTALQFLNFYDRIISIYNVNDMPVCNSHLYSKIDNLVYVIIIKLLSRGYLHNLRIPGMEQGGCFHGFLNPGFCSGFPHGFPGMEQQCQRTLSL